MAIPGIGEWVSFIVTLAVVSFYIKRTLFFRAVESTYVAASMGYGLAVATQNIIELGVQPLGAGEIAAIIPVILGILFYARLSRTTGWLTRFPIAVLVGVGLSTAMVGNIGTNIIGQIRALFYSFSGKGGWDILGQLLVLVLFFGVMYYFLWTVHSRTGTGQRVKSVLVTLGMLGIMMAFGTELGMGVVSYGNLIYERIDYLTRFIMGLFV